MRKRNNVVSLSVLFVLVMAVGCGKKEKFGENISKGEITKIGNILIYPKNYEGKIIRVEGEIMEVCPSGCWFNLKDETGVIYIDIMPSGFAIPQKVGRQATVEGKVITKEGKLMIIGKGVEIK